MQFLAFESVKHASRRAEKLLVFTTKERPSFKNYVATWLQIGRISFGEILLATVIKFLHVCVQPKI